jgi:hypothetical protein
MNKKYYYLEGKDQKGPINIEKLIEVGINPNTLVWSEEMDNWKPAKEVSELADIIKKLPPPPPIANNYDKQEFSKEKELQTIDKIIVEDSNIKLWATVKIYSTIILMVVTIGLVGYSYVNSEKNTYRKDISEKIKNIFNGKTVVLDGEKTGVTGEQQKTDYKSKSKKSKDDEYYYKAWWERDGLYTIFKCESGGFTIKKLTQLSDESFDLEIFYLGDMGYHKPASYRGVTGWSSNDYGLKDIYGEIPNYRQSVQFSYNDAFDLFTKDDETGAYTPGKYVDINNFPSLKNEYYYIENTKPKSYSSAGHFTASSEWRSSDEHIANVYTDNTRVYYSTNGKHYELTLNESRYKNDLLTVIGISFSILFLVLILIKLSKPKLFRNLHLFGKRWKNTSYEEQIMFFEHSFWGSHKFKELINDSVTKGVLKIIDKGQTLNLSYHNKELFYKIEIISKDSLMLTSLKDGGSISFQRVGSILKQEETIIDNSNEEETRNEESNN